MSTFRAGPIPPGVSVSKPLWPRLDSAASLAEPESDFAPAPPVSPPPEIRPQDDPRLKAAQILQDAAMEAEAALEIARREGFEIGRREGFAAGQADLELQRQQTRLEIEKAQVQAELIRQTAEAAAQLIRSDAQRQAQAELDRARAEAAEILALAKLEQHRRLDEAQGALAELAVTAAARLVQGHLALHPAAVVAMVAAGIRKLKDTDCHLRVSPQDLPLLEAQRSALERELGAGLLRLQPDPGLAQGSYIITSPHGQIDARLEQQAAQLQAALNAALGGNSA